MLLVTSPSLCLGCVPNVLPRCVTSVFLFRSQHARKPSCYFFVALPSLLHHEINIIRNILDVQNRKLPKKLGSEGKSMT